MRPLLLLAPALLCAHSYPSGGKEFGLAFLDANRGKPGVAELPSGLQYKVLVSGDGKDHPTKDSPCFCHYEGRTAQNYPDGAKFDSSYDRGQPAKFAPNQVIKGWTEAMQMMVEGDKWELYIPARLAYGARGRCGPSGGLVGRPGREGSMVLAAQGARKRSLMHPPARARARRPPKIPGHSVLVFTIEIKRIVGGRTPKHVEL